MKQLAEEAEQTVPIPVVLDRVAVEVAPVGIAVEVEHVALPDRAAYKYTEYHPYHHPLNTLRVEFYLETLSRQYSVPSFFIF